MQLFKLFIDDFSPSNVKKISSHSYIFVLSNKYLFPQVFVWRAPLGFSNYIGVRHF